MMPRRQAPPGHVGRQRRSSPLIRIERGGMKQIRWRRWITPFAVLKGGHVEMQEHAETQIYKSLLPFEELPSTDRRCAMCNALCRCGGVVAGDHRRRRGLRGSSKKFSS